MNHFHTEIINKFIAKYGYKSYLEIGVGNPENNYLLIECEEKECIDLMYINEDTVLEGKFNAMEILGKCVSYKMTSDEAFEIMPPDKKYDMIFIDGDHTEEQSGRDLINAFKHVTENGMIIMHDTNPEFAEDTIISDSVVWNGEVWKTVSKLRECGATFYTIGEDFGITVIKHTGSEQLPEKFEPSNLTFDDLSANRKMILNIDNLYPTLSVALCCIVKMENLYLRDFVEYYKNLGITQIILYDNNDENGEYPQQVIGDYIDSGYVIYVDARGKYRYQLEAYTECYNTRKNDYDWIGFFDIDEFVDLYEDSTIQEFLSKKKFSTASSVFLYWVQFGDSGLLHYDKRPVYERFTEHLDQTQNRANTFKIFIKGKKRISVKFVDANAVAYDNYSNEPFIIVDAAGNEIGPYEGYTHWCYDCAALNHYQTLTIDEFLTRRFGRRAYADKASSFNEDVVMGIFWQLNEKTEEKERIIKKFLDNFDMKEDNV